MKKILFICLIVLVGAFVSCTKQRDSYYVKYEVNAYKAVAGRIYPTTVHIEMLSTDTLITKIAEGEFVETYGPYKYHDMAYLKINSHNAYILNGKIYISKNEQPFVLKAEIEGNTEISYIIDF